MKVISLNFRGCESEVKKEEAVTACFNIPFQVLFYFAIMLILFSYQITPAL